MAAEVQQQQQWWESGVIYQIYPRSFKDSNNDGIGDLPGITSSLPYLASIGITGVWLSPIYPSPMVDFGYDISNFTDINPEYGTLDDFDKLVVEAKRLGLRVILDFVPNHSSDQHPWFLKSVRREPGFEDYYVWRDGGKDSQGNPTPPNNWLSLFYGSAWTYNSERGQFYLHQFASAQPDLNYSNPKVAQEMKDVISFWLHRGVDGFRIDAIPFLFESPELTDEPLSHNGPEDPEDYDHLEHLYTRDYQETYDMVRQWRTLIDEQSAIDKVDRCIMVEAYASVEMTMKYFGSAKEPIAHFPFNFNFIPINNETSARDFRRLINEWIDNVPANGHNNWLVGNHDNHRVGSRVGPELIDAMNMLILTLPGTAVTYYGEEIGMLDNLDITYEDGKDPSGCNYPPDQWYQRSRDFERTPFQWNSSLNAGFNDGAKTWLPVHENFKVVNVEAELIEPQSHLNVYKLLTSLRRTDVLQKGELTMKLGGENTLIIARSLNSENGTVTLVNFGSEGETLNLDNLLLLGSNITLNVIVAGNASGIKIGSSLPVNAVTVPARDGLVVSFLSSEEASNPESWASTFAL